jgi:glutathione S-transferase
VLRRRDDDGGAEPWCNRGDRADIGRPAGATALRRGLLGRKLTMLAAYPLSALVVVLSLFVYIWAAMKVGAARAKYGVSAPAEDGPEEFRRVVRAHLNTLEQVVIFLPSLALFASAWGDIAAAVVGIFWPLGRLIYILGYFKSADKRGPGFGISFLSSVILLLGTLAAIARRLTETL